MIADNHDRKHPQDYVIDEFGPGIRGIRLNGQPRSDGIMELAEGEYWKNEDGDWFLWPFGGETFSPGGTIIEHDDGTITIDRIIHVTDGYSGETLWRGTIRRGVWYSAL